VLQCSPPSNVTARSAIVVGRTGSTIRLWWLVRLSSVKVYGDHTAR